MRKKKTKQKTAALVCVLLGDKILGSECGRNAFTAVLRAGGGGRVIRTSGSMYQVCPYVNTLFLVVDCCFPPVLLRGAIANRTKYC